MGKPVHHLLFLVGVGLLVLFVNLGSPPLWDRDEPRNAACAREMMERGDWVVPTFNAELRVLKPVMKYWLMISAYHVFGVNEFAARFWFAVFAIVCAGATYWLGRRLFSPSAGLWAGLILLTNLLFVMSGHLAKIDTALTFFSMLGLCIFVAAMFPRDGTAPSTGPDSSLMPRTWGIWVLFYAAIGLAVLAKGLPGAVPAAVLGLFLLIVRLPDRPAPSSWVGRGLELLRPFSPGHFLATFWKMRPLTGLVTVLAVAGPWYLLVGLRTDGEFLRGFFLDHHLGRAMAPLENHSGPFMVYYLVTILLGFFPWSILTLPVVVWLVQKVRGDHPTRYAGQLLACWVGVYVVLFSCAQTKLPSYITPCFPALALLAGAFVAEVCSRAIAPRVTVSLALLTLLLSGVGMIAGVIVATFFIPIETTYALVGLVPLVGGGLALWRWRREQAKPAMVTVGVSATLFISLVYGVLLPRVGQLQQQDDVCARLLRSTQPGDVGFFCGLEPSWVFYTGHPIGPLALPGATLPAATPWKAHPKVVTEFLAAGERPRYIITTETEMHWLKEVVPADVRVVMEAPRFLRKGNKWLILGRTPPEGVAQAELGGELGGRSPRP